MPGAPYCGNCGAPATAAASNQVVDPAADANTINQSQMAVQQPKDNKKIFIIIVALLILIIASGTIYVVSKKLSDNNETKEVKKKQNNGNNGGEVDPEPDPEPNPQPDPDPDPEPEPDPDPNKDNGGEKTSTDLDLSKLSIRGENELGGKFEIVEAFYTVRFSSGYLSLLLKNTSDKDLDYTIYLNYYDESGQRVDRALDLGYVEAGKVVAVEISNRTAAKYKTYDVSVSAKEYKSYFHKIDVSVDDFDVNEIDGNLSIVYKNASDHDFYANLTVLFYKNDKVVFIDAPYLSCKSGETCKDNAYLSFYSEYDYTKPHISDYFDKYEVVVSSAYYWDSDY